MESTQPCISWTQLRVFYTHRDYHPYVCMYVCMYADFCIMMNLNTFCDLVCVHWVHDVRSISTWYGVLLTWRVTLYECVLSVYLRQLVRGLAIE